MDSVKRSSVAQKQSIFTRAIPKVLNIKFLRRKNKPNEKTDLDKPTTSANNEDEEVQNSAVKEAFLAKMFASISSIKAAYAQMQLAQYPYDADSIQSADQIIVSEMKNLSELQQIYVKDQLNKISPETTQILSEVQEQSSLLKLYDITSKKLDSQLKLKESELNSLKEKLAEMNMDNKSLEKRVNSSVQTPLPNDTQLSSLRPSHFIEHLHKTVKSIRTFVRVIITEMESADWNLDVVAGIIAPGVSFWSPKHKCYAFESYVCKKMFEGFDSPEFSNKSDTFSNQENCCHLFYNAFMELKSISPSDYIARKPESTFATFCCDKYWKLVHQKMEDSFFGNLDTSVFLNSGHLPETPFFVAFGKMVKQVWLLHCLAYSFDPEVSIFQVSEGAHFSQVYMECLNDEVLLSYDSDDETGPRVGFTVVPGFRIGQAVIVQCQVYLS